MHTLYDVVRTYIKLLMRRGVRSSYGQFGEDAAVQALLKFVRNGYYVDVGAYHPVLYSNTYALYRRGWSGLAIDPNPDLRGVFRLMRPRDTHVVSAVGTKRERLQYHRFTDASYNTFDGEEAAKRTQARALHALPSIRVEVQPLRDIIAQHKITRIDFLNIDVEGMDIDILESHNWSILPRVIAIEDNSFDMREPQKSAVWQYLNTRGYVLVSLAGPTLVFRLDQAHAA